MPPLTYLFEEGFHTKIPINLYRAWQQAVLPIKSKILFFFSHSNVHIIQICIHLNVFGCQLSMRRHSPVFPLAANFLEDPPIFTHTLPMA